MKKIVITVLCLTLFMPFLAFASGGSPDAPVVTPGEGPITFPLEEPITLEYIRIEHSTVGKFPYDTDYWGKPGGNWLVEQTNINLDITQIPYGQAKEKAQLMLATGEIGDIFMTHATELTDDNLNIAGRQGMIANIMDYEELIPTYLKRMNDPDTQFPSLKYKKTSEGDLYFFNGLYSDMAQRGNYLNYRIDLWRENNLKLDTWDELYDSLKFLKAKYPASYPLASFNWGGSSIQLLGVLPPMWRTSNVVIFDTLETNDWMYGPIQENYKKMLQWLNKLHEEKILHPESFTMSREQYYKLWIQEAFFAGPEPNQAGAWHGANNPDQNPNVGILEEGFYVTNAPPPAMSKGGPRGLGSWVISEGLQAPRVVNAKSKYVREAIAYLDFLSIPHIWLKTNYGEQGIEWDYVNGKPQFLDKSIDIAYNPGGTVPFAEYWQNKYGSKFSQPPIEIEHSEDDEIFIGGTGAAQGWIDFLNAIEGNTKAGAWPTKTQPITQFSEEDAEVIADLKTAVKTYSEEMAIKFITGAADFSEWDNYVKRCKELGADTLVDIYRKSTLK